MICSCSFITFLRKYYKKKHSATSKNCSKFESAPKHPVSQKSCERERWNTVWFVTEDESDQLGDAIARTLPPGTIAFVTILRPQVVLYRGIPPWREEHVGAALFSSLCGFTKEGTFLIRYDFWFTVSANSVISKQWHRAFISWTINRAQSSWSPFPPRAIILL